MTEIDGIRTWSYVHKNKVIHKISDQYVKACRRKVRKTVTDRRTETRTDGWMDGRTDGHHHTIIRPVWRRAYKNRPHEFKPWPWYPWAIILISPTNAKSSYKISWRITCYRFTISGAFLLSMRGKTRSLSLFSGLWRFSHPYMNTFCRRLWPWRSQYTMISLSCSNLQRHKYPGMQNI